MIAWLDDYCLGVELIDKQHKELFAVINRILRILDDGDSQRNRRTCIEAIKYLKSYVLHHFADEEAYQLQIGYEHYEEHRAQHVAFTEGVPRFEQDMLENDHNPESIRRFIDACTAWLVNHIMKSDQAITPGNGANG